MTTESHRAADPDALGLSSHRRGAALLLSAAMTLAGAWWMLRLRPYLPGNAPLADALLVVSYFLGYGALFGAPAWAVWHLLAPLVGGLAAVFQG